MKRTDKFPLGISRGIATSDEYADLTDRERAVFWTAAALSFEPLTMKRLARTMNSKVEAAVGRLVEQGFLEVEGDEIKLVDRWTKVDMSTERGRAKRLREKAAKAAEAFAAPIAQPTADRVPQAPQIAPQPASQSIPTLQPEPAPIQAAEVRMPTFPPAENFEDAYADDWGGEELGIDLRGLTASQAFSSAPASHAPAAALVEAPSIVESSPVAAPAQSKASRKREKALSETDQIIAMALPNFLPRETFIKFVESRKAIKKPLTLHAAELFIEQCKRAHEDRHDIVDLINKAVIGGWQNIYIPERRGGYVDKATAQQAERRRTGGVAL